MVSGAGPGNVLQDAGVRCDLELPGVGQNLIDHAAANLIVELNHAIPQWQLTPCEATLLLQSSSAEPAPDLLYHFVLVMRDKYGDLDPNQGYFPLG